ncbi:MAG: GNAT family N-acetyltransferase [Clostridia bacterium]|nr:GNAT family N-acetyltransferase [Clostridia bacterium]
MLETKNLIIRNFHEEDFFDYWEIMSDARVTLSYGIGAFKRIGDAWDSFSARLKSPLNYAVVLKPMSKVVGKIELAKPFYYCPFDDLSTTKEVSMIINFNFKGKGIMTEAERALLKHSFETLKLNSVFARVAAKNEASLRLAAKCGMTPLYTKEEVTSYTSSSMITTMAITKDEYQKNPLYRGVQYTIADDGEKKDANSLTKKIIIDKIEQKIKMEEQKEFQEVAKLFSLQREVGG